MRSSRNSNPFDPVLVRNYTNDRRPISMPISMPISSIKPEPQKYFTKRQAKGKRKKGRRTTKRRFSY
jgi:hypothetical protein